MSIDGRRVGYRMQEIMRSMYTNRNGRNTRWYSIRELQLTRDVYKSTLYDSIARLHKLGLVEKRKSQIPRGQRDGRRPWRYHLTAKGRKYCRRKMGL